MSIMKNSLIIILFILLWSCKPVENEKIYFVKIFPSLIYDKEKKPQLHFCRYIEYDASNHRQLKVAKSEGPYTADYYKSIPAFSFDHFYTYDLNTQSENRLRKLLSREYEEMYYRISSRYTIDERYIKYIIIEKGSEVKKILYEYDQLPLELKEIDQFLDSISISTVLIPSSKSINETILMNIQDSLFRHHPPPPPPREDVLDLVAPVVKK